MLKKMALKIKIKVSLADDFDPLQADFVFANILAKPLIELSAFIGSLVKSEGQLILSGILNEQAESVQKAYQQNFHFNPVAHQQDWCRLHANKRSA
jgi:ribosomal protein L11 methyltransferase